VGRLGSLFLYYGVITTTYILQIAVGFAHTFIVLILPSMRTMNNLSKVTTVLYDTASDRGDNELIDGVIDIYLVRRNNNRNPGMHESNRQDKQNSDLHDNATRVLLMRLSDRANHMKRKVLTFLAVL
jgi:hypothetical protein